MGVFLVIGMMLYSIGMCLLFERVGRRWPDGEHPERIEVCPVLDAAIPDRVPAEWVEAYRAEQGP